MAQSSGTLEKAKFSHIVITFIASVIITAQSSVNSELNTYTENPLITALINFTTGLIVLSVMMIFSRPIRQGFISIPRLVREGRLKRWQLFGGLSGAFFVASQSSLVQVIGVAIFTVAAVAGQTSAALLVDKAGIGPAGKQPVTLMRIGAAILGIVGVLVSVLGQDSTGQFAFGAVLISFAAGALVSTQPALNGQIANHTGQPAAATMVNFIVGFITFVAIFAPWLAPYDPFTIDLGRRVIPPMWMEGGSSLNLLGTDQLGRDYLSRLIYGARVSMIIGVATVITSGIIGTFLGVMGGFYGGRVDDAVMFAITARLSIPVVLVALAVAGLLGTSFTLVILVLGLLLWDRFAVVARSTTMQIRNLDYVAAARCAGCSPMTVLLKEVLPNIATHLAVVATLEMALAILLEAALSFLGLGVPPPLPSWGLMISEAKEYMFFSPWIIMIPGIALFVLVLGVNLLGDALRDMLGTDLSR